MPHKTSAIFLIIFALLALVFISRFIILGQAIYGDGRYYYAYTRSLIRDKDLNFLNELGHRYDSSHNNDSREKDYDVLVSNTSTDLYQNKYPIGAPLLWVAPFLSADTVAATAKQLFRDFPNNGYSDIYQIYVGLFNILIVTVGLFITYKVLLRFFPPKISALSILGITFGSNLFYYSAIDAINSHPSSFFFSSLFVYIFLKLYSEKSSQNYMLIGVITGFLALVRTQDIVFIALPLFSAMVGTKSANIRVKYIALVMVSFLAVFSLQLISWKIIYGTYFAFPYLSTSEGFNFAKPHLLEVLTNTKNGLLIWSPLYLVSFLGLIFFKKNKTISLTFTLFVLLEVFLISCWSGWSQGEAFGTRMLISTLPFLALGFANILFRLKKYSIPIIVVLIFFNLSAILYFLIVIQNPTYNIKENTQEKAIRKIEKLLRIN